MSTSIDKVMEELAGFMFGYSTGITYILKQNQPLPTEIEITPFGDFNVYSRVKKYDEDVHVIFQLGKGKIDTHLGIFMAKNVITLIIGAKSRIVSSKMPGKSISVALTQVSTEIFNDVIVLFKDDIIAGIE